VNALAGSFGALAGLLDADRLVGFVRTGATFVVVIGVLIVIHELGHFAVARLSGVGVERFSIGFGPVLWRLRGPETEYCVSAIPLGGYVKMVGDDDNPLEGGGRGLADPARAFPTKPLPVRFLIVFAGPGMNFVLAAVIFALAFMTLGRPVLPPLVGAVSPGGAAARAGLGPGDRVLAVDEQPVQHWEDLSRVVQARGGTPLGLRVQGPGGERRVTVTPVQVSTRDLLGDERRVWDIGARPLVPAVVGDVLPGQPAAAAGLRGGDRITAVDGRAVGSWDEMVEIVRGRPGRSITLTLEREGRPLTVTVVPAAVRDRIDGEEREVGRIGVTPGGPTAYVRSDPLSAVRDGVLRTADVTVLTVVGLWKILIGQLDRSNIGGPIQIAQAAGEQARQGPASLAFFTAVISVNLAVLNLLPVPMLDGGHLLFFLIEAVQGRPLSERKREVAQQVGGALLLLLVVFAVYNDLARLDFFGLFR
jgi:regulator of sigma E protease